MAKRSISRRDFIRGGVAAAVAGTLHLDSMPISGRPSAPASRVVLIRRQDLWLAPGKPNPGVVQEMLDQAVSELFKEKDPRQAWKKMVKPADTVGIKSNAWARLPTPPELENAIKKRVMDAGVAESAISIRDRGVLNDPVFQRSTALINVRPMRTHHWSGVGTCIKNYIMFVEKPWDYHTDSCADLATLWELPLVKGKTRLNILVLFTPLFHSVGPHGFNPTYTWEYNGMIAGIDPVAVDATGVRIIQAKRQDYFGDERPLDPPAKHINLADTRHGLGISDPARIEVVKIGWQAQSFI